jgi:hypothetical protein
MEQSHVFEKRLHCYVSADVCSQEYVPFQQYIEGPFLVILHIAKALPSQINAAAAAARDTSSSSSPYQVAYGGFSAADADAASTLVANSSLLSKLRRSLYFG